MPPIEDPPQIEDLGAVPDVTPENDDNQIVEGDVEGREGAQEGLEEAEVADEEQSGMLDETQEQKRWTKRAQQMLHTLNRELNKKKEVTFDTISKKSNRKQAAYKFYTSLILNKEKAITLSQDGLYCKILVEKGEKFEEMV